MNMIKSIEINKIKGIDHLKLDLNLIPNKPSLFVAPNGFGKSSITIAFDSIFPAKLSVPKQYWHNSVENKDCFVKITEIRDKNMEELIADCATNSISKKFDIQVINNKVTAQARLFNINGHSVPQPSMVIKDIIFINTIPEKCYLKYSFAEMKRKYDINKFMVPNLSELVTSREFVFSLGKCRKNFENILEGKRISDLIEKLEQEFQKGKMTKEELEAAYSNCELINKIFMDANIKEIMKAFQQLLVPFNDVEKVIHLIQFIRIYEINRVHFRKIEKRALYEHRKESLENLIYSIDTSKRIVTIKEQKGQLVIKMIQASMVSNGEIDVICFLIFLEKIKYIETQKDLILIIDEVFDYLDDINLIIVQKYISSFIDSFKGKERKIYPIIMTHLNPNVFKNYYFSKMKTYYLNDIKIDIDEEVKRIITNRKDLNGSGEKDSIGKYYLHYHNGHCELIKQFADNGFSENYNTSLKFKTRANEEMQKYIREEKCDYLLVLCALRICIEEYIYFKLDDQYKESFLETKMTVNKIAFAESVGLEIPENFKLLSVLYNDFMHLDEGADPQNKKILFLASKLDNIFIRNMIKSSMEIIQQQKGN